MARFVALFLALFASNAFAAGLVDVYYVFTDFNVNTQAVRKVVQTPLQPFSDYNGAILTATPISQTNNANGVAVFSNTVPGYAYRIQIYAPDGITTRTSGFPASLTGYVNGRDYLGDIRPMAFYYLYPTNTGFYLAAGTGVTIVTNASLFTVSSTGGGGGSATNVISRPLSNIQITTNVNGSDYSYSTVTNPTFTTLMVSNPAASGSSTTFIISGNTGAGGKADTLTTDPSALTVALGGSGRLFRIPSTVTTGILYGDASGTSNAIPPFAYSTNESHVLQFIGTNSLYVSGAGTATANGVYNLKGTSGGISVWTNVNGNSGLALDPSFHVFLDEQSITNGAGTLLYDAIGAVPFPATVWGVESGAGPAPTVVVGTNTFSTNITAYYPLGGSFGKILNTNYYFVNPINGNDTNAVPGSRERPYQNFTNVVWNYAVHTNDVIFLEKGTNYFGFTTIQVSNGVSIVGLGPDRDSFYFAKDASMVDVSDVGIKPGIGSTFANFSGNITIGSFNSANVYLNNLHTVGMIDNFLPQGCSNLVTEGCFFECNATSGNPLIDAGVINSISTVTKNCIFSVRRRGNGASAGRALVVKGGTNIIVGCTFISLDTTNSANNFGCIGLSIEGNGYTMVAGCAALAANTNANNFCGFTNAFGSGGETVGSGPISLAYTNGAVTWVSPQSAKIIGNVTANSFTDTGLTASRLVLTDGSRNLASASASSASTAVAGDGTAINIGGGLLLSGGVLSATGGGGGGGQVGWSTNGNNASPTDILGTTNQTVFRMVAFSNEVAVFDTNSTIRMGRGQIIQTNALNNGVNDESIFGGYSNIIQGVSSTASILGGHENVIGGANAPATESIILGGRTSTNWGSDSLIWGYGNTIGSGGPSFVGGHGNALCDAAGGSGSFIGSGTGNYIGTNVSCSALTGGQFNNISNGVGFVFLGGGYQNSISSSSYGAIPGGFQNRVDALYGFAAGNRAKAMSQGSFVWADSTGADQTDNGQDSFTLRASGGLFLTNSAKGWYRNYGNAFSTSNSAAIRNAVLYHTNSGNFFLFYGGTNSPLAGHENSINNGVISSNWYFVLESPGHTRDLAVNTNGGVELGQYLTVSGSGSNYFGANVNVNGTINFLGGTNTGSFTSIGSNYLSALTAAAYQQPSNTLSSSVIDFAKSEQTFQTNNVPNILGYTGKDASGKMNNYTLLKITNSAGLGSAFQTNTSWPANTHFIGNTWMTNWKEVLVEFNQPTGPTNAWDLGGW